MKRRIEILPRALDDAIEAKRWYEEQREGLGLEFESTLEAVLVGIQRSPELYPKVLGNIRRCLMGRFPYGVFFEPQGAEVVTVIAICHASRDPTSWQDRA